MLRAEDSLDYEISRREALLAQLQAELRSLQRLTYPAGRDTERAAEAELHTVTATLCRSHREAEERESESLAYVRRRTQLSTLHSKSKAHAAQSARNTLDLALQSAATSTSRIAKAKSLAQVKLNYAHISRSHDHKANGLVVAHCYEDVQQTAQVVSAYLTRKAQQKLKRENLEERVQPWKRKLEVYAGKHRLWAARALSMR